MTDQEKTTAEEVVEEVLEEAAEPAEEPEENMPEEKTAEEAPKEETPKEEDPNDKYVRLYAEFQNYRKRTDKEKSDIYAFANEKFALGLLDVIDNFERAMEHTEDSSDPKLAEGMQLILKQLQGVLEKNNVEEIEALGKPFDPNYHNAVMTEAAEEGTEPNTVTKVLQKGYMLNKKVIRPSMVAVSQ